MQQMETIKRLKDCKRDCPATMPTSMLWQKGWENYLQGVSAAPIYKQMEKLEKAHKEALERLQGLEDSGAADGELPADFKSYQKFVRFMFRVLAKESDPEVRAKVLKRLLYKVEVGVGQRKTPLLC